MVYFLWFTLILYKWIYKIYKKKKVLEYHEYAKSNIILSDLGKQGKLYGYESIPFPNRPVMITRE